MRWLLVVQCALAQQATGMKVSPADFGAPEEYWDDLSSIAAPGSQQKFGDMHGMIDHNAGAGAKLVFSS